MIKNSNIYFGFIALVCIIGLGIDMMDIDAAQYASISREMMQSGNFLQLYDAGVNYLDKPPFLFWVSSISLKLFGVNNFAYKLPSFLFAILAVYAVFKFSLLYYQKKWPN
jgi:4-amino-4-deoxy-L-arabinose transferase-like glycosyltransferase